MLLSATRSTPCCAVFGLSEVMAPLLGLKTVAACGFKVMISTMHQHNYFYNWKP